MVRVVGYDQIDLTCFQKLYAFDRGLVDDFDMRARKVPMKPFQIRNKKIAADRIAGADPDLSSRGGGIKQLRLSPSDKMHCRFDVAEQDLPLGSQLNMLGAADKQCLIQFALQSFNRLTDSGLGNKKLFGSFGKT